MKMFSNSNHKKLFAHFIVLFLFIVPILASAEPSKATAEKKTGITYECGDGATAGNCEFDDLLRATMHAVNYGTVIALGLVVVVIAWAGFKLMTSGNNAGERTKVKEMFQKVGLGVAAILGAWLIVRLITSSLLRDEVLNAVPLR